MRTPVSTAPVAYAHGGDSEVLADHFKAAAQRWGAILTHGPDFVRLRRFPTDVLNHEQIERAYLGLGHLLGEPVGQDRHAAKIVGITRSQNGKHHPK